MHAVKAGLYLHAPFAVGSRATRTETAHRLQHVVVDSYFLAATSHGLATLRCLVASRVVSHERLDYFCGRDYLFGGVTARSFSSPLLESLRPVLDIPHQRSDPFCPKRVNQNRERL
jgi:hypothetical protein